MAGARLRPSITIDPKAHALRIRESETARRAGWWERVQPARRSTDESSEATTGLIDGVGRSTGVSTDDGGGASTAPGGSTSGGSAFRGENQVSPPFVVSMLPPEAFRRRRAYQLLQEEPIGMYMLVLLLSLSFFIVSTYLLTYRFPRLFVYVQIMAFMIEGSSLPWLFHGLRGPTARTADFWITAIVLSLLGFITAAAPRRVAGLVLRREAECPAEEGPRALAFFVVGMLTLTVGMHALWTGATISDPHEVFEPPDYASTPQLARAMLSLGWATTYVVLSYLRAQAGIFGLKRNLLLVPSVGAAALSVLSLVMLLLV